MMRVILVNLGLLLCLSTSVHAIPEIVECKGATQASVPNGCAGITQVGCCDPKGRTLWCEGNDLFCLDCNAGFQFCGWNLFGYYDCGQDAGSADPSGDASPICDTCPAECAGGVSCSEACSGQCGVCPQGQHCLESGSCYTPECAGKKCGFDGKGFSCGTCSPGKVCHAESSLCLAIPDGCAGKQGAGCEGCACESCVCEKYPSCCTDNWDVFCATACELECEMDCSPCPAEASCGDFECGEFCGVDCGSCGDNGVCFGFKCCQKQCDGKTCGDDGCGGSCGNCEAFDECVDGNCSACQPACEVNTCGPDGCGGECGQCADGETCDDGLCVTGLCAGSCGSAGAITGWASDPNKKCYCDSDCFNFNDCCDGVCSTCPKLAECCVPDCEGKVCGDNGCDGSCGSCEGFDYCEDGACLACQPDCEGKGCGADSCGSVCGSCVAGMECNALGQCVDCIPQCDGKQCGTDECGGLCGQCLAGTTCEGSQCVACEPVCDGKTCGDDGCGGSCGTCSDESEICGDDGQCYMNQCGDFTVNGCCDESFLYYCYNGQLGGLDCGLSGCGWSPAANAGQGGYVCGYGGEDPEGVHPQACFDCKPDCKGKQCGDNGCDGSCGSCLEGEMCGQQDLCVSACESDCADRECGMDVCGDSCGSCAEGYLCSELGKCYPEGCELDCDGRTCGDNGCGGVCGTCADGQSCDNGVCGTLGEDHGNQGDVGGELDAPGDGGCGGCASDAPAPLSLALWFLLVFGCLVLRRRQPS